ncbi:hypothetical protein OZX73_06025 [Bifidobacterium sp. ESL0775]|uniref:hypothetical protein n=1 Tax=Bifidobacterium sp. ESL0775 TaxID=2983230 RepID=UPI0023F87E59|nr:hypothetical protein [Bifidobacterium sp. ESL0775]WEV68844.1 hypothetical protein OZX73_06025 [Bifidobacterium sp. ESL0775]
MEPNIKIDKTVNIIIGMGMRHEPFDPDEMARRIDEGARHLPDGTDAAEVMAAMRADDGFTGRLTSPGWFETCCYEYGVLCAGTRGLEGYAGDMRMLKRYLYLRYLGEDGDEIARRLLKIASGGGDADGDPDGGDGDGPFLALVRRMRDHDDRALAAWSGLQGDGRSFDEIADELDAEASQLVEGMDPGRRAVMEAEDYLARLETGDDGGDASGEDLSACPAPVPAGPELG